MNHRVVIIWIFILILVFVGFGRILQFSPWIDDTKLLWSSLYNLPSSLPYYNHPGLPLYFLVWSMLFGDNYFFFQAGNLFVKCIVSFLVGRLLYQLTKQQEIRWLATVFFAVSFVGLETISAPIMNVSALAAIPLLLFFSNFFQAIQVGKAYARRALLWLIIGLVLDPGRMFPVLMLVPLYLTCINSEPKKILFSLKNYSQPFRLLLAVLLSSLLVLLFLWFSRFVMDSQLMIGVRGLFTDPAVYLEKVNRAGNLFAAVGNSYTALFFWLEQNEQNTGIYQSIFAYLGVFLFLFSLVLLIVGKIRKLFRIQLLAFFLLWSFLFYLPNWFSEPRAPMAAPHRYLFLSSIGSTAVFALAISSIHWKTMIILVSTMFIAGNIYHADRILTWQARYRDMGVVERLWNQIDQKVPIIKEQYLFVFEGAEPWRTQSLALFGGERFLLRRQLDKTELAPIITSDPAVIQAFVTKDVNNYKKIFRWKVLPQGELVSH